MIPSGLTDKFWALAIFFAADILDIQPEYQAKLKRLVFYLGCFFSQVKKAGF
jgi:hypothetical protein